MSPNIYKLNRSLGKFRALRTNNISEYSICAEISDNGMDQYNNGSFDANIYTNGELADIEINGWTFSFHIHGTYHLPGSYSTTSFHIEAVDPEGTEVSLYNTPYYCYFREDDVLCSYMDLIYLYSNFENANVAQKFYQLLRSIEGNRNTYRVEDRDITPKVGIAQADYFREFYTNYIDDKKDKYFKKQIKDAVNRAIDKFKDGDESSKIP